jgi:hypothetical protein
MDGWPIVGDGSGKVGILDSKAHECNMDRGPTMGDGSGKVAVDNKVVGGGMANLVMMTRFFGFDNANWMKMAKLWGAMANWARMTRLWGKAMAKWVWGKVVAKWV